MAPESFPEGRGSRTQFPVNSASEDFTSSAAAEEHETLEKTIDFLVDLLTNGDIGKQRQAAEALTKMRRACRDRLREIGATSLLVDRLSSVDVHIREHMMTLLFRLSADEEEKYRQQPRRPPPGDMFNRRTTTGVIYNLLRVGPGPKAYETAAKLLIKLTNIDRLKDSIASSGGIEALIEMLRFKAGLSFQKEAIASLITLLRDHNEHKHRAIRGGLAGILLRLLVHAPPPNCDIDGILELMAVLATYDGGHDVLVQINTPQALVTLVKTGKLVSHREQVARLVRTLTEDYKQAKRVFENLITQGGEGGEDFGKDGSSMKIGDITKIQDSQNCARNGDIGEITKIQDSQNGDRNGDIGEIMKIQDSQNGDRNGDIGEITKIQDFQNGDRNGDIGEITKIQDFQNGDRNGDIGEITKIQDSQNGDSNGDIGEITEIPDISVTDINPRPVSSKYTSGPKPSMQAPHNGNGKPRQSTKIPAGATKTVPKVPEEFFCPLSKKIMKDPVSVSTGQTYEREFIQRWIDKGKLTCPKTRYRLRHTNLRPNFKLKARILNHEKNVELALTETEQKKLKEEQQEQQHELEKLQPEEEKQVEDPNSEDSKPSLANGLPDAAKEVDPPPSNVNGHNVGSTEDPVQVGKEKSSSIAKGGDQDRIGLTVLVDQPHVTHHPKNDDVAKEDPENDDDDIFPGRLDDRPATDEEIALVQTLMEVLTSRKSSEPDLRAAALELHGLAFGCQSLRDEIVVVGALDALASLLSPEHSARTQEAGVATLLVLSLDDENKKLMAHHKSAVVPAVVGLLKNGSEDGREKAASTLFSLSIPDENKVSIGASDAIPALVDILSGRDPLSRKAQKDTATCLLTLSIYAGNKARAVRAGVVPHLVALLDDDSLLDLVLAMLAVLSSHVEGREAIEDESTILPKLMHIIRSGTDRNIENALTIFTALLTKNSTLIREAMRVGADKAILALCKASGPGKIKDKTVKLLDVVKKQVTSSRGSDSRG